MKNSYFFILLLYTFILAFGYFHRVTQARPSVPFLPGMGNPVTSMRERLSLPLSGSIAHEKNIQLSFDIAALLTQQQYPTTNFFISKNLSSTQEKPIWNGVGEIPFAFHRPWSIASNFNPRVIAPHYSEANGFSLPNEGVAGQFFKYGMMGLN